MCLVTMSEFAATPRVARVLLMRSAFTMSSV